VRRYIEDDDERAAAADAAVAEQSYGFGLACAVAGDATSESPSVELDGAFAIDGGVLSVEGEFHAVIPCGEVGTVGRTSPRHDTHLTPRFLS